MRLSSLAKKLLRTLARIFPQCTMVSQAVAFNLFLAFFSSLLGVLALVSGSLKGEGGSERVEQLSTILPQGSWQLVSDFLRREGNPWVLVLFGWVGTLLVGTQVMKLIMEGIRLVYGDRERHSFLGRQIRGLLLFCVSIGTWLVAVGFSVSNQPLRQWITQEFGLALLAGGFWTVMLPVLGAVLRMLVLALIYRVARPGGTTWRSVLPGAATSALLWWGIDLLFGIYVRKTQYGPVYGGLAAAIGLMVRMRLSALVVFFGAAWNAESAVHNEGLSV